MRRNIPAAVAVKAHGTDECQCEQRQQYDTDARLPTGGTEFIHLSILAVLVTEVRSHYWSLQCSIHDVHRYTYQQTVNWNYTILSSATYTYLFYTEKQNRKIHYAMLFVYKHVMMQLITGSSVKPVFCKKPPNHLAKCQYLRLLTLLHPVAVLVLDGGLRKNRLCVIISFHFCSVPTFAVLVFKCLHGLAPEYLSEFCKLTTGRSHLRSANTCLLSVPRTRTTYGDRSFAVTGPVAWNSLPVALRSSDVTDETFRRHFIFNCFDN